MKSWDIVYIEAKLKVFIVCLYLFGCFRFSLLRDEIWDLFCLTPTYFHSRLSQDETYVVSFVWALWSDRGVVRVFGFHDIDDHCFYIYFLSEFDIQIIKMYVQHNC